MIKIYQFLQLNDELQYQTIWEIGKHLESVVQDTSMFLLYALGDFFVEVEYSTRTNTIISKRPFKQGELLEKYLKELPEDILA